jgi:hypothetical protein
VFLPTALLLVLNGCSNGPAGTCGSLCADHPQADSSPPSDAEDEVPAFASDAIVDAKPLDDAMGE